MDISIIILTWNSQQYIERCVSSLLDSLERSLFSFEIIIVDNGSTDGTKTTLAFLTKKCANYVKAVYLEENKGTTVTRNIALRQAEGDYLAILDSDVEVSLGTFELLLSRLKKDSSIGLIAPKLVYPSGSLQKSTDQFPTLFTKIKRMFFLKQIEKAEEARLQNDISREVDYAISAFWVFPRKILQDVGYLDEKIFYAPEDLDYCLRIWKQNFRIMYEPATKAVHYAQEISRGFKFNKATREHVKGLIYYYLKHRYLLRRPLFQNTKGHTVN